MNERRITMKSIANIELEARNSKLEIRNPKKKVFAGSSLGSVSVQKAAEGRTQSKTLRAGGSLSHARQRLGLRQSAGAFPPLASTRPAPQPDSPQAFQLLSDFGASGFGLRVENPRFVACADGARLVSIGLRTARRAPVSESGSLFHLSAGGDIRGLFRSVSEQSDKTNLTRCGIFRGKIPPRKNRN